MERSSTVAVLACLLLVVSAGVVPGVVGSANSPSLTAVTERPASATGGEPSTAGPIAERRVSADRPQIQADNTTARLTLPRYRITQSQFETVRLGLASTLQSESDGARLTHSRISIEREFDAADSVEEKKNTIDNALIDLEADMETLEARERRAIREYSDGNITGQTLVRRLARIDASAREMHGTLGLLRTLGDRIGVSVFDSRIRDVEGRLTTLEGPVRQRAATILAGETSSTRIHVTASDEGVVMATMVGDQYVREAKDLRNRNSSAPPELDFGDVTPRVEELYPWVTDQKGGTDIAWLGSNIWQFRASHGHGALTAYVDAGTRQVFYETQRITVDDMPTTTTIENSTDELRVTVERTYVGGPLRIYVEDAASNAAVNARISVNGHDIGNTGADGHVRTIEPRPSYTVTVLVGDDRHTITVERPFDESED